MLWGTRHADLQSACRYTSAELARMDRLTDLLICLEGMSPEDIEAAVGRYFASV